jgi:hypothetical protein
MAGGALPGFSLLLHQYFFYTNAALLDRPILGLAPILSKVSFRHSCLLVFESPIATNADLLSLSSLVKGGSVWGIAKTVSLGSRWLMFL